VVDAPKTRVKWLAHDKLEFTPVGRGFDFLLCTVRQNLHLGFTFSAEIRGTSGGGPRKGGNSKKNVVDYLQM